MTTESWQRNYAWLKLQIKWKFEALLYKKLQSSMWLLIYLVKASPVFYSVSVSAVSPLDSV